MNRGTHVISNTYVGRDDPTFTLQQFHHINIQNSGNVYYESYSFILENL